MYAGGARPPLQPSSALIGSDWGAVRAGGARAEVAGDG